LSLDIILILRKHEQMAYQSDVTDHPFWEHSSDYTAATEDHEFMGEVAYVLVTLYKSEIPE
jgi:hypothetical protein